MEHAGLSNWKSAVHFAAQLLKANEHLKDNFSVGLEKKSIYLCPQETRWRALNCQKSGSGTNLGYLFPKQPDEQANG